MGEIWDMIHPGAKFLSIYEPMKSDKLPPSKIQSRDKQGKDIPIPKQRN